MLTPIDWSRLSVYMRQDAWQGALDALEAGQIIAVPWLDRSQRRAITRALCRGAEARGFALEHRDGPDQRRAFRRGNDKNEEGEDW